MKPEYTHYTLSQASRKVGVSLSVMRRWVIEEKRIAGIQNPAEGVYLIPVNFKRPKSLRPHDRKKGNFSG